ncbi:TrbG/VirB9 family P-type conjugative transfer protein [Bacteriovorax sp. PP10]|uniref:TrbG/VirB9 family P-type conjugative transfer protein n=1 Tax=Bacteriovorax antarcticus TaxID=3088717 RepID=A0ABU5VZE0_9BACT|nr:TrbG/VirB9 family P-type conjugative transfer protein [Bacteriovorax sp. PP10]MEA9358449.1 TrbG/VirB9 family P-type conjugative transfer protein [Bacteriovorax sp. PP10]
MSFYILANQITSIFLSLNFLTTLSFGDDIRSYLYGGNKDEVFIELANNNKTLVIKAKKKELDTNMLVVTSKNKYYFHIKFDEKNPHQFIEIYDGEINSAFKKILDKSSYEILQGGSSLLFVNKTNKPILVNEQLVQSKEYFSLGVPIIVNGERILN